MEIFSKLSSTDSSAVRICQSLMEEDELRSQILYISANFGFLQEVITKLEKRNQPLVTQVNIVKDSIQKISESPGNIAVNINTKFQSVISKNVGFSILSNIANILGEKRESNSLKYNSEQIQNFKFAPLTSVDVERSFSMYKNVLSPNRQSFLFENLSQQFLIHCNNAINE